MFLTRLLCNGSKGGPRVWKLLEGRSSPGLRSKLDALDGSKPWLFPVLVTARRAPAAQCLLEGLQTALTPLKGAWVRTLTAEMDESLRGIQAGSEETNVRVSSLLSSFAAGVQRCGYRGVLLLVDELGKVFEAAAHAPQRSDVGVMQEIAEQGPCGIFLLFFGFASSFDDYGRTSTASRGSEVRYSSLGYCLPLNRYQVIRMIAAAME